MNMVFKKATAISYPMSTSRLHLNQRSNLYQSIQSTLFRNPSAPFDVLDCPVLVDVHIHPAPPLANPIAPEGMKNVKLALTGQGYGPLSSCYRPRSLCG